MAKGAFHGPLEQIDPCCWRIPTSYKQGMRVEGRIFASDRLLQQVLKDQAPDQVANVAFLPGIQVASLAMPDIHWGYGFCIGGVAATDPDNGGVISPGGVGYDINCLSGKSLILHRLGYTRPIEDMAGASRAARLACFDLASKRPEQTAVQWWLAQPAGKELFRLTLASGDQVEATADHPFFTPAGMRPLGQLRPGDAVGFAPFRGVPYETPSDDVIVSEQDVLARLASL